MKLLVALLLALCLLSSAKAAPILYNLFQVKGNRLIVIMEPTWCSWCKMLDPHLKVLKDEGYDIHEFTRDEWKKAKPKPTGLPDKFDVPTILYVLADNKGNKVIRKHNGGKEITADYIKRYLTK